MNILFIHKNMPGQFKHLAPALARHPDVNVVFLTQRKKIELPNVRKVVYKQPQAANPQTHHYLYRMENAVRTGQQVVRALQELRRGGFVPDLIIGHTGWGETLFCKDIYPDTPLIGFSEYFYRSRGGDVGFFPDEKLDLDLACKVRSRTADQLLTLEGCDVAVSPTQWQRSVHPKEFHDKIEVIFDGIDTDAVKPFPVDTIHLPGGRVLERGGKIVTYVARNLEPYRGYKTFIHMLPHLQALHPDAEVLVVGEEGVSYGAPAPEPLASWREAMDAEVEYNREKVHFLGRLDYETYLRVLNFSTVHVYLTIPFVLSWSCLEAMACGRTVVASDTAPVREVITDGENGILTDFFDAERFAETVGRVLDDPEAHRGLGEAARRTVVERYALDKSLPEWLALIDRQLKRPLFADAAATRH